MTIDICVLLYLDESCNESDDEKAKNAIAISKGRKLFRSCVEDTVQGSKDVASVTNLLQVK